MNIWTADVIYVAFYQSDRYFSLWLWRLHLMLYFFDVRLPRCFHFSWRVMVLSFLWTMSGNSNSWSCISSISLIEHFYSYNLLTLGVHFHGALSYRNLYIGNKLISIIPISSIYKHYDFKIMVISFRMLYHFTWNLKTNLNIVSNLDFNFISNKNDNYKHKFVHDVTSCLWT